MVTSGGRISGDGQDDKQLQRWLATRLAGQLGERSDAPDRRGRAPTSAPPSPSLPVKPPPKQEAKKEAPRPDKRALTPMAAPLPQGLRIGQPGPSQLDDEPVTVRADRAALLRELDLEEPDDPMTVRADRVQLVSKLERGSEATGGRSGTSGRVVRRRAPATQIPKALPPLPPRPLAARPGKPEDPETVQLSHLPVSLLAEAGLTRPEFRSGPLGQEIRPELPPGPLPSAVPDRSGPTLAKVEIVRPEPVSTEGKLLTPAVLFPMLGGAIGAAVLMAIILAFLAGSVRLSP